MPRTPSGLQHRLDDLGDGQPALRIQGGAPGLLEPQPGLLRVDALVVGVEHRDQPGVRRALHVVLPAQRVQPGARPSHVAGDRAQRDEAAGVVGAGGVLGDPHPPVDDRGARLAPGAGDLADGVRVHAGDLRGPLGRVVGDRAGQLVVVRRAVRDELPVDQPEPDDLVHHRVVERDVGAGFELHEDVGVLGHRGRARVDVDDLGAAAAGLLEERAGHRVVRGRVGTGDDHAVGVGHVAVGGGHRPGADALEQRRDRGGVAQPGAVVDVVRAEAGADELLEEVGLLVRALRRAEACDRARSAHRVDLAQPAGDEVERLLPGGLPEVRHDLVVVDQAAGLALAAALVARLATATAALTAVDPAAVVVAVAADVRGERALRVGRVDADQRGGRAAAARPRSPSRSGPSRTACSASPAGRGPSAKEIAPRSRST